MFYNNKIFHYNYCIAKTGAYDIYWIVIYTHPNHTCMYTNHRSKLLILGGPAGTVNGLKGM